MSSVGFGSNKHPSYGYDEDQGNVNNNVSSGYEEAEAGILNNNVPSGYDDDYGNVNKVPPGYEEDEGAISLNKAKVLGKDRNLPSVQIRIHQLRSSAMAHSTSSDKLLVPSINEDLGLSKASLSKLKKMSSIAKRQQDQHTDSPLVSASVKNHFYQGYLNNNNNNNNNFNVAVRDHSYKFIKKTYEEELNHVRSFSPDLIKMHKDENRSIVSYGLGAGRVIFIKPSGKIYALVAHLGKGSYKTTEKGLLIGILRNDSENGNEIEVVQPKYRAIGLPIPGKQETATNDEYLLNQELREEKKIGKNLSHVNIVKSITNVNLNEKVVVAELCDGDVNSMIKNKTLSLKQTYAVCAQMSMGIGQLHDIGIVHRDCKLDNFLYKLDEHNELDKVLITDFGFSGHSRAADQNDPIGQKIFLPIVETNWPTKTYLPSSDIYQLGIAFLLIQVGLTVDDWKAVVYAGRDKLPPSEVIGLAPSGKIRKWKEDPELWVDLKGNKILDQIQDPEVKEFILGMISPNRDQRPVHQEVTAFFERKAQG